MLKRPFFVLTGIIVFALVLLGASLSPLSAAPLAQTTSTPLATTDATTDATTITGTATTDATTITGTATTTSGTATTGTATTDATTTQPTATTTVPGQLPQTGGNGGGTLPLASLIVLLFLGGITALTLARRSGGAGSR